MRIVSSDNANRFGHAKRAKRSGGKLARVCAAVMCAVAMVGCLVSCAPGQPYVPEELTPVVSSPTIIEDGVLHVGVNTENAPLAGQPTSSMRIVGIDVDVAAALADRLGLKLDVVDVGADAEGALTNGTVDVVLGIDKAETVSFWTSETYLPTAVALFALADNTEVPATDTTAKFAAQVSSKSAWAVTSEYDGATVETTDDLHTAFEKLASGEVQYVAADAIIGSYAAHSAGIDAHIVALMQQPSGYAAGVLDGNTELRQVVGDAVTSLIDDGVIGVIQTKWLGAPLNFEGIHFTPAAAAAAGSETVSSSSTADDATEGTEATDAETAEEAPAEEGEGTGEEAPAEEATGEEAAAEATDEGAEQAA